MADGGGGGEGTESGAGSADWETIYAHVEATVRGEALARAEALAADRARQEAADRVQRGSWEVARRLQRIVEELQAAAREKDAEMDRLRAEAADARKKLQADASQRGRWESAYLDLLLGANQKLAELRDGDMKDSRTRAETPNSKEIESCTKPNQNIMDRFASDLSAELRKLKQAHETLSSKKDKEVSALLSEKDSLCNELSIMQQDYAELLKNKKVEAEQAAEAALQLQESVDALKVLAQKKDDEIARLQADAVEAENNLQEMHSLVKEKDDEIARLQADAMEAEKNLQEMHSLVKEKDDEIQRLKVLHHESIQKHNKDISETHKIFWSDDPSVRSKSKNNGLMQMVESYISQTEPIGKDWQDEPRQKRRHVSFISNDDEQSGSDEDDDGQSGSDKDDDEQSGSDEVGDEQSGSDKDGEEQSGSDKDGEEQSRSDEDGEEQSRCDEDGDEQSRRDDDGQNRCDEHDEDEQSGLNEETINNPVQKSLGIPKRKRDACNGRLASGKATVKAMVRTKWYCYHMAPAPLCSQKLQILNGRYFVMSTGNWGRYVRDVKVILADQPDKHKEFIRFLCNFENWRIEDVARTMADLLDGYPELICRFNRFLPKYWQIEIEEDEEHHPDESTVAAAGLIMLKEAEQAAQA